MGLQKHMTLKRTKLLNNLIVAPKVLITYLCLLKLNNNINGTQILSIKAKRAECLFPCAKRMQ